ncbi:hypothetical protein [Acidocella sp.]|uniref:hypothetical protein n=1 Tax=Acidocella sp. TaxID=50710 RepID=UPI003CFF75A4
MFHSPSFAPETLLKELDRLDLDMVPPDEWLIPSAELCAEVAESLGDWPPATPTTAKDFALCAAALQRLDRWHRPLLPSEVTLHRLPDHEAHLDRMAMEDRFNTNLQHGTIIARQAFGSPFLRLDDSELDWAAAPSTYSIICSLLDICVFLPAVVMAGAADAASSTEGSRPIALVFRRFPPEEIGILWPTDAFRLALAPVVETDADARLWVQGDRYAIELAVPLTRLEAILRKTFVNRAHMLLLPEMTVDADLLPDFIKKFKALRREFALADDGEVPRLSLMLIGVIEAPKVSGGMHRNYVAAISASGKILFTQDKLSHWNLDAVAQSRFGIDGQHYPIPLYENTSPGINVQITEFDGFGRLMALICADMSHNMPGDWISDNIGLDWLYAPVMDGSTCGRQGCFPWIVQRALRVCDRAGTIVMVTNSMVMTHWNNQVIARHRADPSYPYKTYETCGIGLIARRDGRETVIQHTEIDLLAPESPILRIIDWSMGWTPPPAA